MTKSLKEAVQECRCAKCQIKKRASDIYANIKEFMRKEVEKDQELGEWKIMNVVRIAQASRPFYFVRILAKHKGHDQNCTECKGEMWAEMTCVIQESPGRHDLNLLPFVDILEEVQKIKQ